jgi:hypothetical protein
MPGIQITVSPALMGSSHLVQIISVETVPYTLALSRDQLVKETTSACWDRIPISSLPSSSQGQWVGSHLPKPGHLTAADRSCAPLHCLRRSQVFVGDHRLQRCPSALFSCGNRRVSFT